MDNLFKLAIAPDGVVTAIYSDSLADLLSEGRTEIKRASAVEPTQDGTGWLATMTDGSILGPFKLRSAALAAEVEYLEARLF